MPTATPIPSSSSSSSSPRKPTPARHGYFSDAQDRQQQQQSSSSSTRLTSPSRAAAGNDEGGYSSSSATGQSGAEAGDGPEDEDEDWLMSDEDEEVFGRNGMSNGQGEEDRGEVGTEEFIAGLGRDMASRESAKVQRTFYDTGYREGITSGKLSTLQQGFDEGFNLSAPVGRTRGELRGQASAASYYLSHYKARSGLTSSTPVGSGGMRRFKDRATNHGASGGGAADATEEEKENARKVLRSVYSELNGLGVDELLEPDWDAKRHEDEHAGRKTDPASMVESEDTKRQREGRLPAISSRLENVLGTVVR